MSYVNKVELRRAAEAAPKGEWDFDRAAVERHFCAQVWDSEGKSLAVLAATEAGSCASRHIAAANPSVVLSLLDEHDALLAERDALEKLCQERFDEIAQLRAELDAIRGQEPVAWATTAHKPGVSEQRALWNGEDGADYWIDHFIGRGCNTTKTALYALPPQQPDSVSVPREVCDVPLYAAINRACGELPDGWIIEVGAERGGAWVTLYNAEMEEVEFPSSNGRLDYTVNDAVEFTLLSTHQNEEREPCTNSGSKS